MKKLLLILFLLINAEISYSADTDFFLDIIWNSTDSKHEIYKTNQTTGASTLLKQFNFPLRDKRSN